MELDELYKINKKMDLLLKEFKEDIGPNFIVMMGLPAAGKSTFLKNVMGRFFPGIQNPNIMSTDSQLRAAQYELATKHWDELQKIETKEDLERWKENNEYFYLTIGEKLTKETPIVKHPVSWGWLKENRNNSFNVYYKEFRKDYYASYLDLYAVAYEGEERFFKEKLKRGGNYVIYDTVAKNYKKVLARGKEFKKKGYFFNIIYLDIPVRFSIKRDEYRKKTEGRGMKAIHIRDVARDLPKAIKAYMDDGENPNGIVDRVMIFKWKFKGNTTLKGNYKLLLDKKYNLKRRLKKIRKG